MFDNDDNYDFFGPGVNDRPSAAGPGAVLRGVSAAGGAAPPGQGSQSVHRWWGHPELNGNPGNPTGGVWHGGGGSNAFVVSLYFLILTNFFLSLFFLGGFRVLLAFFSLEKKIHIFALFFSGDKHFVRLLPLFWIFLPINSKAFKISMFEKFNRKNVLKTVR